MREEVLAKIIEKASKIWNADAAEMNGDVMPAAFNPKSANYSQMTTFLKMNLTQKYHTLNFKRCKHSEKQQTT